MTDTILEATPTVGVFGTLRLWRRLIKHYNLVGQITFSEEPKVCKVKDIYFSPEKFVTKLNNIKRQFARLIKDYPTPPDCLNIPTRRLMEDKHIQKQMDLLDNIHQLNIDLKPYYEEVLLLTREMREEGIEIEKVFRNNEWAVEIGHLMFTQVTAVCENNIAEDGLFLSRYRFDHAIERHARHMKEVNQWKTIMALRKERLESLVAFHTFSKSLRGVLDLNKEYVCQLAVRECGTCYEIRLQGTPTYRCEHDDEFTFSKRLQKVIESFDIIPSSDCLLGDFGKLAQELKLRAADIESIQVVLDSDYKKYLLPLQIGLHGKIKKREEILEAQLEKITSRLLAI